MSNAIKQGGIYTITNATNGRVYVGSAVKFSARWKGHRSRLNKNAHHSKRLQNAWNKYGEASFTFAPLLVCSKSDLIFFEQRAIDAFSREGEIYNTCKLAGNTLGFKHSTETLAKIASASKAMPRTAEHYQKVSDAQKGKFVSPETRAKIAEARKRQIFTPETKAKLSLAMTGRKMPVESVIVGAEKRRGQKRTPEQRQRIADGCKNKVLTPEAKFRMSQNGKNQSRESIEKTASFNRGRKMADGVGAKRWATRRANQAAKLAEVKHGV